MQTKHPYTEEKTLRDILGLFSENKDIEVRLLGTLEGEEIDTLFGFCRYDADKKELTPLDGDSYSLDEKVCRWEECPGVLTVWIRTQFLTGKEFDEYLDTLRYR